MGPLLRYGDPGLGQWLCPGRGLSFPNCSLVSRIADIGDRSIAGWIGQREQQEQILRGGKFIVGDSVTVSHLSLPWAGAVMPVLLTSAPLTPTDLAWHIPDTQLMVMKG